MWIILGIVLLALLIFYSILSMDIPGLWKFALSVIEMIIVSQILIRKFDFSGEMGLVLLRSKHGLAIINRLAKKENIWKFLSDTGTTVAYGLLSRVLMKKNTSAKSMVTGILILLVLTYVVAPNVFPFLTDVLEVSVVEKAKEQVSLSSVDPMTGLLIFLLGVFLLIVGGLFFLLFFSIVAYGLKILSDLVTTVISGTDVISGTAPGGTLLLPGVNLPFFEGVAALLIILIVHEGAHAILSRVGKVPVLSSGLVLFGILPIGAFVEPDEHKLAKTKQIVQTRVLIAGSTSNLLFSIVFFVLFLGFAQFLTIVDVSTIPIISNIAAFIYLVLGMSFTLNFIVGTVNLLPLPLFDGYRALDVNIKNKMVVKSVMIIALLAFLMNFLPWLFSK